MTRSSPDATRDRLDALFRDHAQAVYRYARARLPHEDAEDVVCDVFVVAWNRLPEVVQHERAWLLGVARRTIANRYRSAARARGLSTLLAVTAPGSTPDHAGQVAAQDQVARALEELGPRDREVLTLLLVHDLSSAEMAVALGCRPNTASARTRRARERLARVLAAAPATLHPAAPEASML